MGEAAGSGGSSRHGAWPHAVQGPCATATATYNRKPPTHLGARLGKLPLQRVGAHAAVDRGRVFDAERAAAKAQRAERLGGVVGARRAVDDEQRARAAALCDFVFVQLQRGRGRVLEGATRFKRAANRGHTLLVLALSARVVCAASSTGSKSEAAPPRNSRCAAHGACPLIGLGSVICCQVPTIMPPPLPAPPSPFVRVVCVLRISGAPGCPAAAA